MLQEPGTQVARDPLTEEHAAFLAEEGVAHGRLVEEGIALGSVARIEKLVAEAGAVEAVAIDVGAIAFFERDSEDAGRCEMICADITPQRLPRFERLGDHEGIAVGRPVGAANDAMLVARGREGVGYRAVLQKCDTVPFAGQCPGCREP